MRDFRCPRLVPPVEYLIIQNHATHIETGLIPRSCAEAAGVVTGAGTTWFTREQSARLAAHKHYTTAPSNPASEEESS